MKIDKFVAENTDHYKDIMHKYNLLNAINVPRKLNKFPYNILQVDVQQTYKSISGQIKNKIFYANAKRGGARADVDEITVFLF
jgi:hypothetical protein